MECVSVSNKQLEDLKNENLQLKIELTRLQGELKASNLLLEERSNELAIERSLRTKLESTTFTQNDDPTKEDLVLVVGSSIIRDLYDNLYKSTKVEAASGATPQAVTQMLENHRKNDEKFSQVIIVAGGNQFNFDGAENQQGITETISDLKETVAAAQEISEKVSVCQLPLRIHKANAASIINEFNGRLSELPCEVKQTQEQFYLADGTPNDGYLNRDLIHLNLRGSAKLMKSMGLGLKDPGNQQVVRNKAAYKNIQHQEPQPQSIPSSNGYADAVRLPQKKTPPKSQRRNSHRNPRRTQHRARRRTQHRACRRTQHSARRQTQLHPQLENLNRRWIQERHKETKTMPQSHPSKSHHRYNQNTTSADIVASLDTIISAADMAAQCYVINAEWKPIRNNGVHITINSSSAKINGRHATMAVSKICVAAILLLMWWCILKLAANPPKCAHWGPVRLYWEQAILSVIAWSMLKRTKQIFWTNPALVFSPMIISNVLMKGTMLPHRILKKKSPAAQ